MNYLVELANMITNKNITMVIYIIIAVVVLFPIKVSCGRVGASCTTAPDTAGYVHRIYKIKPLVGVLLESVSKINFPVSYYTSYESQKVR